jgi:hypothetical protein
MKHLILLIFAMLLTACGPIYKNSYFYQAPATSQGQACIDTCIAKKKNCESACSLKDQDCRMKARQEAYFNYKNYLEKQKAQGLPKKSVGDFDYGYFHCGHACDCVSAFNSCYESCGGTVSSKKVCVNC